MANVLQLKRGTTTRRLTYTPAPGEPVVDLTQNKLYYGNGTTVGGVAVEAEDSSKVFKVLPLSTAQAYRDLASFYSSGAAVNGAIVIHLPASKNAASTMMQIKIKGYNYLTSTGAFELLCGFYQYSSTNVIQFSAALLGSFPSDQVRYAKAADHTVIILGDVNTIWAYPNIHIAEAVCSYSGYTDWENGWSITIETDLSAYTVKATPDVYGGPRAKTADVLTTARTIGGVSFNGSANINLPGVNTTGNQSTTGNAATATKLATARTINGVAFDGTSNITIADATKLPLTGGTINGSLNVTGGLGVSSFSSTSSYSFLNGSAAQSINIGGLLVSNSYSDASRVPVNGAYVKGQVEATGGFLGNLTGNATSATSATSANYLTAVDNRSLKPTNTTKTSLNNYFVSLGGLTGTANTAYGDLLVMNGYGDTSGGEVNALFFSKTSTPVIYHYRAAQGATTWGTAYELAYTTSNVASASKLQTARTFTYTGDVTGSVSFDGAANVSAAMTLANSGVTAGTYKSVTVDAKGRVTAGTDVVTSLVTSTSATGTTNAATTNTDTFLNIVEKVGTANASPGTSTQVTGAGTVTVSSDTAGKLTITGAQSITGNAATATKLATIRTINGVNFDGTANITVADSTKAPLASPALTGTPTAPTATDGTNTTQLATTAFVQNTVGGYLSKTGLTGGTVTLTDVEVSNAVLSFSGTLTSNLIIVVPVTNRRLWSAINATTGNFTLTVKTASGTGVTVAQGKRNLIYTDGTNVQDGFNDFENIALTGAPTTPTAAVATNSTQVASTAFVQAVNNADTGSSSTALTLKTARTFTYTGDVTGSVSFNGGANVSTAMTLANTGVAAGTYKSVTVDTKGRVTAGADVITSLVTSTSATGVSNVATTNTNTFLNVVEKVGAANVSAGTSTQITGAGSVTVASDAAGKLTITGAQSITGNAATATKLQTARTINGVAFDGTANITIGESNGVFIGAVQWFNGTRAGIPGGYAAADGQLVNRTAYPELWASVNASVFPRVTDAAWLSTIANRASYSQGDGSSTFRFPDLNGIQTDSLKGLFVRGDGNAGVLSGTVQGDAIRNIVGTFDGNTNDGDSRKTGPFYTYNSSSSGGDGGTGGGTVAFDASRVVPTADENRPVSAVGIWIIRVNGGTSPLPASGSPATLLANIFNGSQKIVGGLEVTGDINLGGASLLNTLNNLPMLGVGQTWQNMLGSRASGTIYRNTTGKPIAVVIGGASSEQQAQCSADSVTWVNVGNIGKSGSLIASTTFVVPDQHYYRITAGFGLWSELR